MDKLKHIKPSFTELSGNRIVLRKSTFNDIINNINLLTDTVNEIIDHQTVSEENIKTLAKSIEIIGG